MSVSRKVNFILSSTALNKPSRRAALLSMMVAAGALAAPQSSYAIDDLTTPLGENVVGGSATFDRPNAGTLNINQNTDRVVINWDSFNIGKNGTTQFYQPGKGSLAVNRVTGKNDDPTQILGSLKANGRVMVLDRNGVFFGANSRVDVGGIVASTGDVDTGSVMSGAGQLQFTGFGDGSIVNDGVITAQDAGLVAFVGKNVANNGVINARLGKVALAAGDTKATVDLYGDGLVEFALDDASSKVAAKNSGVINAEGGVVAMSATAAKGIVDNVINMDGVINVSSVTVKGGKIILSGGKSGKVTVSGKMDASGVTGGKVAVTGQNIDVANTAEISATGAGSRVDVIAQDHADFRGTVLAKGGDVEVSGYGSLGFEGLVQADSLLLDPTWAVIHSGSLNNPLGLGYVLSAQALANSMASGTVVDVTATDFIDVGTRITAYNTGNATVDNILNAIIGNGNIDLSTYNYNTLAPKSTFPFFQIVNHTGTTQASVNFISNTVNFNKDLKMGDGNVQVTANNVNLNAQLKDKTGALLGDARIDSTAGTVNVISDAAKIQQGLWLVKNTGGTVNVAAGTYLESVLVDKAVTLNGANVGISGSSGARGAETIVDPNSPGFLITADNVTLDGFEITGAAHNGVHVQNGKNATIKNNVIHDVDGDGVYAIGADGLKVQSNKIYDITSKGTNNGSGVQVVNTNGATVGGAIAGQENTIYDTGWDGVRVASSSNVVVHNNDIDDVFRTGVFMGFTKNSSALGNQIDGTGRYGVNVEGGEFATVTGNNVDNTGLHGINLLEVLGTTLVDGNFVDSTGADGIHAEKVAGLKVLGNQIGLSGGFENIHGDGIYAKKNNGIIVQGNEITNTKSLVANSGSGIQILDTTGGLIGGPNSGDENTIYNTGWDGVRVAGSSNIVVQNNDIDDVFRTGVFFGFTKNSSALGNQIDGTGRYGVNFEGGQFATVTSNNIDNTGIHGINLLELTGNNLVDGNFVDSTGQATLGDGIHAEKVVGLKVLGNKIGLSGGLKNIHGDGVFGSKTDGIIVQGNEITNTKSLVANSGSGVQILDTAGGLIGGPNSGDENTIYNTGWDGVRVANFSSNIVVQNNDIDDVFRTGVFMGWTKSSSVLGNQIDGAGRYGVNLEGGEFATVTGNNVDNTGIHGINLLELLGTTLVSGNFVDNTGLVTLGDGIHAEKVAGLKVLGNQIGLSGGFENIHGDGIYAKKNNGIIVQGNEITNTKSLVANSGSGIQILDTTGGLIGGPNSGDENTIYNTGWDGVRVAGSSNIVVQNNDIDDVFRTGVFFGFTKNSSALGNQIDGTGRYGVNFEGGQFATVTSNNIDNTGIHGINLLELLGTNLVDGNHVDSTGQDGIHAVTVAGLTISGNFVGLEGPIGGNGIFVDPSNNVQILANQVNGVNLNGIYSLNNDDARIAGNTVTDSGLNGILVEGGTNVKIGSDDTKSDRNTVTGSGENGIEVNGVSGTVRVLGNIVSDSGNDGIQVYNTYGTVGEGEEEGFMSILAEIEAFVEIAGNIIDGTDDDGVDVSNVYGDVYIHDNSISNVGATESEESEGGDSAKFALIDFDGADGIHVDNVYGSGYSNEGGFSVRVISNNVGQVPDGETPEINGATDDGIEVVNAHTILVDGNDVYGSGDEGIVLEGYGDGFSSTPEFPEEPVFELFLTKVFKDSPWKAVVTGNTVDNSGDNGIQISGFDDIYVGAGNVVNTSVNSGLYVSGAYNGNVKVEGNTFSDNDIGAYFESGLIDLTGESNTFNNGRVGLKFAPVLMGSEASKVLPSYSYLELVDDDDVGFSPASQNPPTNFGGTIGRQIFNNQSQYFVELGFDSTAFFDPGTPTWLNGLNSSYNGITPATDVADYDFLESMFYHWVDTGALGRFWFGAAETVTPEIDQQDLFNTFSQFAQVGGRINVVLLGLPRISGGGATPPAAGGTAPGNLNDITPAAGDEETASLSPEQLNEIQTAAGGDDNSQNSSCWSDAASSAQGGGSTTFSFSSVIDQSTLSQDSACGSVQ